MTEPTPYAAAPAGTPGGAPAAKWNVLSIISLVTSLIGMGLVGVITGHIAMSQIKKTGDQGKVLAIIGTILGYIGIVVGIIVTISLIAAFSASSSYYY